MRKHFLWLPGLCILMLISFSCKKESIEADTPQKPANEKLIPKIKSWLEEQKNGLSKVSVARIESLESNLSYAEIRLEKYNESSEFIVIPILREFKSANNNDKDPVNYLVLVFENQDKISRGNIIQYISSNGQKLAPQNSFYNIFTYKDLACSGQFTILSITDYFQYELKFENGKLRSVTDRKKKTHPNNGSGKENSDCIDWYLQTWYVWSDGSMTLQSEVYVFTTCDGDCAQPRIANGRSYGTSCSGGGGGGGNPIEYEYAVSKAWRFPVASLYSNELIWTVTSYETISGIKKASETCGGHFTNITHESSYLDYGQGYTWLELAHTVGINTPCEVQSSVSGKVTKTSNGQWSTHDKTLKAWFDFEF